MAEPARSDIEVAHGRFRETALSLLYHRLPRGERERQFLRTHEAVARGEFSLDDLLIARVEGEVAGVLLAVRRPGRAAFLWPPVVAGPHDSGDLSCRLLRAMASRLDAEGVLFTQCLLDPDDGAGGGILAEGGYPRITDLVLMRRALSRPGDSGDHVGPTSVPYAQSRQHEFARVVEQTFIGSLDCPALAGVRSGEETLAMHRTAGPFDRQLWRLYRRGDKAVGVLLSVDHDRSGSREIMYLGIVSDERGRGLGRALVDDAATRALAAGRESLEVAVDSANRYALAVYRGAGFVEQRRMAVHLRLQAPGARRASAL